MKYESSLPMPNIDTDRSTENSRDIYFELPENGRIVDDCVIYVSLYQDGFTTKNDKEHAEAVCMKISGIPTELYRSCIFSPICFISSGFDYDTIIQTYVNFESVMGRNGLYLRVKNNDFAHLRYSIEAVDGDTVAQFKMEGIGSNTSNCPCFLDCYRKRFNTYMLSLCPVHSMIAPPCITDSTIPITILPENNRGISSLCSTISMMMKYGNNNIEEQIRNIIGLENSEYISKANHLMSIIKKLGFSRSFTWMPNFINEEYNTLQLFNELVDGLSNLGNDTIISVINKIEASLKKKQYSL